MTKKDLKKLIEIFKKHDAIGPDKYDPEEHVKAEQELLSCGRENFDFLIENLFSENMFVRVVIARILGNLGDIRALESLKKVIADRLTYDWYILEHEAAVALMKLGEKMGQEHLKSVANDTSNLYHRHSKNMAQKALLEFM